MICHSLSMSYDTIPYKWMRKIDKDVFVEFEREVEIYGDARAYGLCSDSRFSKQLSYK